MKRYLFIFGLIYLITVSVFLIGKYDFVSDSSLYTIRAFGWTDYIGAGQKGPVEWLGHSTWWSRLSFQDSPPVVFAIEYIFLRLFGGVTASAQVPFFIAEIIIYCSIYFCVKKIRDEETALWSSTAFAVSSLSLWSTLSGNLEGVQSLFIVLHFLSTAIYIKFNSDKYLYLSAVFMGLSLMSKYTAIFIVPSFIFTVYSLEKQNGNLIKFDFGKLKKYIIYFVIVLVIISPTVIYNYHVYKFRGNFDTALSAMIGMNNELGRSANFDFVGNVFDIMVTLFRTSSWPYMLLIFSGFIWLAIKSQKKQSDLLEDSVLVYFAMFFIMLGFMGGGVRWLPIFIPIMSVISGLFIAYLLKKYNSKILMIIICAALIIELFYSVNTNILYKPVGKVGFFSSDARNESLGFNELEKYLNKELQPLPGKYRASVKSDLVVTSELIDLRDKFIMYDGRINWFAKTWYIEKYFIYYKIPVFSYENSGIRNIVIPKNRIDKSSLVGSGKTLYFIRALDTRVMNPDNTDSLGERLEAFAEYLDSNNIPFANVANRDDDIAFRVYKIEFK